MPDKTHKRLFEKFPALAQFFADRKINPDQVERIGDFLHRDSEFHVFFVEMGDASFEVIGPASGPFHIEQ
mgnify:CR=1 FL=1